MTMKLREREEEERPKVTEGNGKDGRPSCLDEDGSGWSSDGSIIFVFFEFRRSRSVDESRVNVRTSTGVTESSAGSDEVTNDHELKVRSTKEGNSSQPMRIRGWKEMNSMELTA